MCKEHRALLHRLLNMAVDIHMALQVVEERGEEDGTPSDDFDYLIDDISQLLDDEEDSP